MEAADTEVLLGKHVQNIVIHMAYIERETEETRYLKCNILPNYIYF